MLDRIRGLVFKLGFRPKPGSILYSPSRQWREIGNQATQNIIRTMGGEVTVEPAGERLDKLLKTMAREAEEEKKAVRNLLYEFVYETLWTEEEKDKWLDMYTQKILDIFHKDKEADETDQA